MLEYFQLPLPVITISCLGESQKMSWRSSLIDYLKDRLPPTVEGDILEFGTFLADLTVKLAELAETQNRTVYTVDVCNLAADKTVTVNGLPLSEYYQRFVDTAEQQETIINEKLSKHGNVKFIKRDSSTLTLPKKLQLCVCIVDGCHMPNVLIHDIMFGWRRLTQNGLLAIHDYEGDIEPTTKTVNQFLADHKIAPEQTEKLSGLWLIVKKN